MYISAIAVSGFRNLDTTVELCHPLSVIVGENNAGKSNVIDALRVILEPELGPNVKQWLREDDFTHDGSGNGRVDELEIEVHLRDLDQDAQARLCTCLSPKDRAGAAKLRLRATIGPSGRVHTQLFGGDAQTPDVDRHAREAIRFVYLHPLRDAARDLRPGRDNRLVSLVGTLAPREHPDREKIEAAAKLANDALEKIQTIIDARAHVARRLSAMTGSGGYVQKSDLAFSDPQFDRVVGALRAKIGELAALEMEENGLGYNNLLYMAVLLAALADAPSDGEPTLRVLLVEEPEAHLHPQLQDLLMRFLETQAVGPTQVITTTHSPAFASSARVERLTVMTRDAEGKVCARLPRDFGLEETQLSHLKRFLDVTKAALFFARGVILVEGVAEQLLVPVIAERINRPLAPAGVTVINVGGVAFAPFTDLFGKDKLPQRLAVISDSDGQPGADEVEGAPESRSPRAASLSGRAGDNVLVSLATRTLEWDLALAGNGPLMATVLTTLKPRVGPALSESLKRLESTAAADLVLEKVENVKGSFAQELADLIGNPLIPFEVPAYLREAIEWVTPVPDPLTA